MKFRFGLVIGLFAGYVLGARAGYERYQQIQSAWRSVRRSDPAQKFSREVRDLADRAGTEFEQRATRGVEQLGDQLRSDGGTGSTSTGTGSTGSTPTGTAGGTSSGDADSEMDRMR